MPFLGKLTEDTYLSQTLPLVYLCSKRAKLSSSSSSIHQDRPSSPFSTAQSRKRTRQARQIKADQVTLKELSTYASRQRINRGRPAIESSSAIRTLESVDSDATQPNKTARKCRKCHQTGHYAKTCGKRK